MCVYVGPNSWNCKVASHNFEMENPSPGRRTKTVLPSSHLALWRFLNNELDASIVSAGSGACCQMLVNMHGRSFDVNDVDYWHFDGIVGDMGLRLSVLQAVLGK